MARMKTPAWVWIRNWFLILSTAGTCLLRAQDMEPPTLVSVDPADGAIGVAPTAPVRFTFSEPMRPQQAIFWLAPPGVIQSNLVQYAWSSDGRTLSATYGPGWPAGAGVSWIFLPNLAELGINSFVDLAGNEVEGDQLLGGFTVSTGGGGVPPVELITNSCGQVFTNTPQNFFSVSLDAHYEQLDATSVTPRGDDGFSFTAVAVPRAGSGFSSARLRLPGGTTTTLPGAFGSYVLYAATNNLAALRAEYPAGNYVFELTNPTNVPASLTLSLPGGDVPVIRVTNFEAAQSVDASAAFTLTWAPLGGSAADPMFALISTESGATVFESQDPGCPGALTCASTSFTIPAGTLRTNTAYRVSLWCQRGTEREVDAATFTSAGILSETGLELRTRGGGTGPGPVVPFRITSTGTGPLSLMISPAVAGRQYRLERSTTLNAASWTTVTQATATGATLTLNAPIEGNTGFLRVVGQ
jgi:hypothetical protein